MPNNKEKINEIKEKARESFVINNQIKISSGIDAKIMSTQMRLDSMQRHKDRIDERINKFNEQLMTLNSQKNEAMEKLGKVDGK